jgi:CPA1 family monovalent cation:H+ antiporter
MDVISAILVMLMAVVASGVLVRMSPIPLPLPLVQIVLGALIAYVTGFHVQLDPDVFFLLFLPPLLFLDGWRIPKHGLFRDGWTILELALGLVLFTVIGLGFFLHWLLPAMPLAVAFALAAVLSPTDPIAVSAITARAPMPKRLMHILESESLLNDASGLLCLRLAVAAISTGSFSLGNVSLTFLQLAIGGVGIGVVVTLGIARLKNVVSKRFGEESGSQILISLLIPFAAYLVAEKLHCSGILAVVAAGVTMSYVEIAGQVLAITRVRRNAVWDTVQFSLNGTIFVLLGQQFPRLIAGAANSVGAGSQSQSWNLALYVGAITLTLAVLRFAWVWASLRFTLVRAKWVGERGLAPNWRLVTAASLAGVRGAITLAGVLTLPLILPDGSAFPMRDLAILLAAGVITLSLVVASAFLPLVLKRIEAVPEPARVEAEDRVRVAAAQAAIRAIALAQHEMAAEQVDADVYAEAAAHLMDIYRKRIEGQSQIGEAAEAIRRTDEIDRKLRLAGLRAERDEIFRLTRARDIEDDVARKLVRELDLVESRYCSQ